MCKYFHSPQIFRHFYWSIWCKRVFRSSIGSVEKVFSSKVNGTFTKRDKWGWRQQFQRLNHPLSNSITVDNEL